jgi:hypothetical protein
MHLPIPGAIEVQSFVGDSATAGAKHAAFESGPHVPARERAKYAAWIGKVRLCSLALMLAHLVACSQLRSEQPSTFTPTASQDPASPAQSTDNATLTPSSASALNPDLPVGFPVAPDLQPMQVIRTAEGKRIEPHAASGPTILEIASGVQQRSENDDLSNKYGWNCRVHNKHEGAPAVDWYLPEGTPVVATMRGQAELYVITTSNSFEYYGVQPGLTLGLPDPSTPLYPLPGPGGGMGIVVSIVNGDFRAEYGHLQLSKTVANIEASAFVQPFSPSFDYPARFGGMAGHLDLTLVASWPVEQGDVVGFVGNTGYSDVSHLHYQITTRDRKTKFCPTFEPFPSNGWLFEPPDRLPR